MRRALPLLVSLVVLAACEPSWKGSAPVTNGGGLAGSHRPGTVTVYGGDTVFSIARKYNLSVRELIDANGLKAPYALSPGMVLRLPGGGSDYVVQKGDSLILIARRHGVDFASLAAVNNKRPPYVIHPGERLSIPRAGGTQVAMAPAHSGTPNTRFIASPNAAAGQVPPPRPAAPTAEAPAVAPAPSQAAFAPTPTIPAAPAARAGSTFLWPVKGEVLAEFGPLPGKGQHNDGINIAAAKGTPVKAAENGVVAYVGNELKGFGNLLLVKHADGWMTAYAHTDQLMVRKGDTVTRGQTIATVGSSGSVTTPQLHFEIRRGTQAVNPTELLGGA
ncbi:MAG: peptidoglycan DD-metalloendopeptidase family protein [Actinomycetota bacterium]